MGTELQAGQVLMEYTGSKTGTTSVQSRTKRIDGRPVRYTYGGAERLIAVWQEDVSFLESLGFRKALDAVARAPEPPTPQSIGEAINAARRPAQVAQQAPAPAPAPTPVPAAAPVRTEEVTPADPAAVAAAFNPNTLQAQAEAQAQQHRQRGRPRKQG